MRVERINPPTGLPVSLTDADAQLRLDGADPAEAQRMALAAAREVEHYCSIALLTQTIRVTLNGWPLAGLEARLPIGPVLEGAALTVTVDGEEFEAVELGTGQRPTLRVTADDLTDAQRDARWIVTYEAGFGDEAAAVPADLAHAILDQAAALYDQRGGLAERSAQALSPHTARIAARYRGVRA